MAIEVEKLFTYGTLQQDNVQISSFGRLLDGVNDKICGYKLEELEISDFEVVSKSGKTVHNILKFTGNKNDIIEGIVYDITPDELKLADNYEVDDYKRKKLATLSGQQAWVYVGN
jgi:Gamma-glutamyl cyclotransferase, AIG2-like